MSSGVKVDSECVSAYNEFKLKKNTAFIVFGFNKELTKIVVLEKVPKSAADDSVKAKNAQWEDLITQFPNDDVRYAVADVHYNLADGQRTEMVFVSWAPETASVKRRMLMASSKDALKNTLVGCKTSIQACSYPDLDLKGVVEKFKGTLD